MTVRRTNLHLQMEEAPVDPFDDDGPKNYRVVVVTGQGATRAESHPCTGAHSTPTAALQAFSAQVRVAATRHELDLVDATANYALYRTDTLRTAVNHNADRAKGSGLTAVEFLTRDGTPPTAGALERRA